MRNFYKRLKLFLSYKFALIYDITKGVDFINPIELETFLEENKYIIFIRSHHLDKINFKEINRIRFLNSDKIVEISGILNIFDMLISDYSGMIFDFLLLNKPLLLLPYDYDNYNKNVGICFDYSLFYKIQPKFNFNSQKEFISAMNDLLEDSLLYKEKREKLRKKVFETYNDNCKNAYLFLIKKIKEYNI